MTIQYFTTEATSGYGNSHSSYDSGGHGSYSSYSSGEECCPLVLDPLLLAALLGFIAAATYFLQSMFTNIYKYSKTT